MLSQNITYPRITDIPSQDINLLLSEIIYLENHMKEPKI